MCVKFPVTLTAICVLSSVVGLSGGGEVSGSTEKATIVLDIPEEIDADSFRVTVRLWEKYDVSKEPLGVIDAVNSSIQLRELPKGFSFYEFKLDEKSRLAGMWLDPPALRVKKGQKYKIRILPKHMRSHTGDELQDALTTHNWKRAYEISEGYPSKDYASLLRKRVGELAGYKDSNKARMKFTFARKQLNDRWKKEMKQTTKTARIVGLQTFYLQPDPVLDDLEPLLSAVAKIGSQDPENWRACLAESSLLYRMERFDKSLSAARRILKLRDAPHIALANAYHRCAAILYILGEHEESLAAHEKGAFHLSASGFMTEKLSGAPRLTPLEFLEANTILCESVMRFEIPYRMILARKDLINAIRAKGNR